MILRLHVFQHIWFEDLGVIQDWAHDNGFNITRTVFYKNESLPDIDDIDWLIVLGGPMNIYEEDKYPWLKQEKQFIKKAIKEGKKVLGICLGAQLIADALGAKVFQCKDKEIGWFLVRFKNIKESSILKGIPKQVTAFHWHQDTFEIPADAVHLAQSDACYNQAFSYNCDKVIGFQFHFEFKQENIKRLLEQYSGKIDSGPYIQHFEGINSGCHNAVLNNDFMRIILSNLKGID